MTTRTCDHCRGTAVIRTPDRTLVPCSYCDPQGAEEMMVSLYASWARVRDRLSDIEPGWVLLSNDPGMAAVATINKLATHATP